MSERREAAARRSRWLNAILRDDRIGPKALAVLLVLGQRADLSAWPRVALSDRSVADRLAVEPDYVVTVVQAASALGYLHPQGWADRAGRAQYRAATPALPAVTITNGASEAA